VRRCLEALYRVSGWLAALCLGMILLAVVWQVVSRWMGRTADATETAGMCLAASTFFGLASTFRAGAHVRINLLTARLRPGLQRVVELFNCTAGAVAVGIVTWNMWLLVMQSHAYHDVSPGLLAMPFWIPQTAVALGLSIFLVALIYELVWLLQGGTHRYDASAADADAPVA